MSRLRGVATTIDGGVSVVIPTSECVECLMFGGGISREVIGRNGLLKWARRELGISSAVWWRWAARGMPMLVAKLWEMRKLVCDPGWRPDLDAAAREALAARWVEILERGGLSEREAVSLIVARDRAAYSLATEIVDVSELPNDRTRRNEWRRSSNGGPIITPEEDIAA